MVASELDSFDGRKDPERCNALVNQLRVCQDKVCEFFLVKYVITRHLSLIILAPFAMSPPSWNLPYMCTMFFNKYLVIYKASMDYFYMEAVVG